MTVLRRTFSAEAYPGIAKLCAEAKRRWDDADALRDLLQRQAGAPAGVTPSPDLAEILALFAPASGP